MKETSESLETNIKVKIQTVLEKTPLRKYLLLLPLFLMLISCGSSKRASVREKQKKYSEIYSEESNSDPIMFAVSENALEFLGTPYEYGGESKKGVDCSGLIYTAFLEEDIALPRTSRAMSLQGKRIDLEAASIGDLLFFQTNKNRKVINHVGLVIQVSPGEITFIHSTTSSGVIVSNLNQKYWHRAFVMARRIK